MSKKSMILLLVILFSIGCYSNQEISRDAEQISLKDFDLATVNDSIFVLRSKELISSDIQSFTDRFGITTRKSPIDNVIKSALDNGNYLNETNYFGLDPHDPHTLGWMRFLADISDSIFYLIGFKMEDNIEYVGLIVIYPTLDSIQYINEDVLFSCFNLSFYNGKKEKYAIDYDVFGIKQDSLIMHRRLHLYTKYK